MTRYMVCRNATTTSYGVLLLLSFLTLGWIVSLQHKRNDIHDGADLAAATAPTSASSGLGASWTVAPDASANETSSSSSSSSSPTVHKVMHELLIPIMPDVTIREKLQQTIPLVGTSPFRLLENCLPTAQLVLQIVSDKINSNNDDDDNNNDDDDQKTLWILRSLDETKTPKAVGMDEFYITWHEQDTKHPSAVALIHDQHDGTYELDFVVPPVVSLGAGSSSFVSSRTNLGPGNLTIHYQYTCGIGNMAPPSKDDWNDGGALFKSYTIEVPKRPTIRSFHHQPPVDPVTQHPLSLSTYQQVLVFGDSAMRQFVKNASRTFKPNLVFRTKRRKPWTTALIEEHLMVLGKQLGRDLDKAVKSPLHTTALLVGSSIWDILASKKDAATTVLDDPHNVFDDHLKACKHFVTSIRHRYQNVDVLWKSPTAMHIHVVTDPSDPGNAATTENVTSLLDRVRYMSSSRMAHLYQLQRQLMQELKVPFLDVYEATYLSASWTFPGDGRHYLPELNKHMLEFFYA